MINNGVSDGHWRHHPEDGQSISRVSCDWNGNDAYPGRVEALVSHECGNLLFAVVENAPLSEPPACIPLHMAGTSLPGKAVLVGREPMLRNGTVFVDDVPKPSLGDLRV